MPELTNNDTTALGDLDTLVGYHIRRASGVMAIDFQRAMVGTGMRQVLVGILSVIAANPGINQGNAGNALGIKRANMVSLSNELVDAKLVSRAISPTDRRAFTFTLTAKGRKVLEDAMRRISDHENRVLAALSPAERDTLRDLLGRVQPGGSRARNHGAG